MSTNFEILYSKLTDSSFLFFCLLLWKLQYSLSHTLSREKNKWKFHFNNGKFSWKKNFVCICSLILLLSLTHFLFLSLSLSRVQVQYIYSGRKHPVLLLQSKFPFNQNLFLVILIAQRAKFAKFGKIFFSIRTAGYERETER